MTTFTLYNDDCLNVLRKMEDNSVDACVTDPPYGLSFMGKSWDYDVPQKEIWEEVLRVLKPGGHLLAFFGSRTYHRGAVQIEDAGFEVRDQIMWLYGSGFPKSHNVSKDIDKVLGAERTVKKGIKPGHEDFANRTTKGHLAGDEPATNEAAKWEGWGTALKPAHEPIVLARKPINQTVANNVLEYGTGALNIDECRVEFQSEEDKKSAFPGGKLTSYGVGSLAGPGDALDTDRSGFETERNQIGRWPANIIHDGSDEVVERFPNENSRFFYCAKASKADRDEGLDQIIAKLPAAAEFRPNHMEKALDGEDGNPYGRWSPRKNIHPTVKPTELMRYLCKLVTPKDGVVLDPFMGSGSTGKAAAMEDFSFIGIEMTKEYFEIAEARVKAAYNNQPADLSRFFTD